jgi:hypothetical protein
MQPISKQRIGKHASATINLLLQTVFSILSETNSYKELTIQLVEETIKYGHESQGTRTIERLRWQGPAAYTKGRPILSSERVRHKNKTVSVKE